MAHFPGCQAYPAYLREAPLHGLNDVALWHTLPALVEHVSDPALLEMVLWTGRILEREIDRRTTVGEVLEWVEAFSERELAAEPRNDPHDAVQYAIGVPAASMKLAVGPIAVARWRRVIDAFEEERSSSLQSWRSSDRGAVGVLDEVHGEPTILRCTVAVVEPALHEGDAIIRAAAEEEAPQKKKKEGHHCWDIIGPPPPPNINQELGPASGFEDFLENRKNRTGNLYFLRPTRSADFKRNYPTVPLSHRWHEQEIACRIEPIVYAQTKAQETATALALTNHLRTGSRQSNKISS